MSGLALTRRVRRRAGERFPSPRLALLGLMRGRELPRLTFDDGPGDHTPAVLEALDELGVSATFFVCGKAVDERPELLPSIVERGHRVGNHTYSHPALTELPEDLVRRQIVACDAAIRRAGVVPCGQFRPPYGDHDPAVEAVVAGLGLELVLWDVDPRDWEQPPAESIAKQIKAASAKQVVLLHDGNGDRTNTVQALRMLS